jgi:hypothetical protein
MAPHGAICTSGAEEIKTATSPANNGGFVPAATSVLGLDFFAQGAGDGIQAPLQLDIGPLDQHFVPEIVRHQGLHGSCAVAES